MNPPCRIVRACLAVLVCFSAPVSAGLFSGPDPDWEEGPYEMPAAPSEATLHEFFVSAASPNRFLIDTASLTVGEDGVIRYVLVTRAAGGAENVTFEGIRCDVGGWRVYASGRATGEWVSARDAGWQPIRDTTYNRARAALARDFFCDSVVPARDRDEVLRRVRGESREFQ